jgi:hypothetical protein
MSNGRFISIRLTGKLAIAFCTRQNKEKNIFLHLAFEEYKMNIAGFIIWIGA